MTRAEGSEAVAGRRALRMVREGFRHVAAHPLRSALTALTSAVAIAVTVNVISLNYGLDEDVRRDVARFGRLTIDVGRFPVLGAGVVPGCVAAAAPAWSAAAAALVSVRLQATPSDRARRTGTAYFKGNLEGENDTPVYEATGGAARGPVSSCPPFVTAARPRRSAAGAVAACS